MAFFKNVSGQKIAIFAYDTAAQQPKTGDAANITAQISLNGAATAATNDANPTELDATDAPGIYIFDMTQAETNAELIILSAVSVTADIEIEPVVIFPLPVYNDLSAAAVNAEVDQALADYAPPTKAELDAAESNILAAIAALVIPTVQAIAAAVWTYITRTLTANINNVTIVSAVSGNTITVHQYDTWSFTLTDSNLALSDYDNLIFMVKNEAGDADNDAILYLDLTTGLKRIGGSAPSGPTAGSLTVNSATSFTVLVAMSEVVDEIVDWHIGTHQWWLKGIDVDDNPDQGFTLVKGRLRIVATGIPAQI